MLRSMHSYVVIIATRQLAQIMETIYRVDCAVASYTLHVMQMSYKRKVNFMVIIMRLSSQAKVDLVLQCVQLQLPYTAKHSKGKLLWLERRMVGYLLENHYSSLLSYIANRYGHRFTENICSRVNNHENSFPPLESVAVYGIYYQNSYSCIQPPAIYIQALSRWIFKLVIHDSCFISAISIGPWSSLNY